MSLDRRSFSPSNIGFCRCKRSHSDLSPLKRRRCSARHEPSFSHLALAGRRCSHGVREALRLRDSADRRWVFARIHGRTAGEMRVLARINSLDGMADALGKHGLGAEVYSAGNLLSLSLEGTQFTIENLLPSSFDERLIPFYLTKQTSDFSE